MKKVKITSQGGFSLTELLIVLVVMAIIVAFAVALFGASASNLERQNIARQFKVSLERARFDSVKRRATNCADMSRVEVTSPTSFNLVTDTDQNGTLDLTTETRTIEFGSRSNVGIVSSSTFAPYTIRFDERGHASSGPCGTETAVQTPTVFCNLPCTAATANETNSNVIFVSPTGTAAFLPGGSSIPTFSDPTVSNQNSTMNPLLAIWDALTANGNANLPVNGNANLPVNGNANIPVNGNANIPVNGNANIPVNGNANIPVNGNTNVNTNTMPYCNPNQAPVTCICAPDQHLQDGKCRKNH